MLISRFHEGGEGGQVLASQEHGVGIFHAPHVGRMATVPMPTRFQDNQACLTAHHLQPRGFARDARVGHAQFGQGIRHALVVGFFGGVEGQLQGPRPIATLGQIDHGAHHGRGTTLGVVGA